MTPCADWPSTLRAPAREPSDRPPRLTALHWAPDGAPVCGAWWGHTTRAWWKFQMGIRDELRRWAKPHRYPDPLTGYHYRACKACWDAVAPTRDDLCRLHALGLCLACLHNPESRQWAEQRAEQRAAWRLPIDEGQQLHLLVVPPQPRPHCERRLEAAPRTQEVTPCEP